MFDIDTNNAYFFAGQDYKVEQKQKPLTKTYEETKKELDQIVWFDPVEKEYK